MKIDSTITLAFLVSLVAFISPIVTTILNNLHQSKIKKQELFVKRKIEAIENYLSSVGKFIGNSNWDTLEDFGVYAGEVYLYTPSEFWDSIEELNELIFNKDFKQARPKFHELSKQLSHYISQFIKK